ncbi:binding-protein-dependent transport systems inner membrane component [Ignisphaera aggregans DSM 17230]|uniref:Binding-protein-dependent transport systems inner membrane component n=1 Tax=Ignisphaera aggregans (strain DSM 17230 / JCM 13409 / AQ1.S1) TaxID=583356 RepID=E0SSA8_IGNAA|nr:binding-protein-dependent transport systems inner membrane component [Ignisphaera aggregans DSM 17230]
MRKFNLLVKLYRDIVNLAKRSIKFRVGIAIIIPIIVIAIFSSYIAPYPDEGMGLVTEEARSRVGLPPCLPFSCTSIKHLLGTDDMGRDLLSRIIMGTPTALLQTTIVIVVSVFLGLFLGIIAGFYGRAIEILLSYIIELFLVVPSILLAAAFITIIGRGLISVILALILSWWSWYARLTYVIVRQVRELEFVVLSKLFGYPKSYIVLRHIFPNVAPTILVQAVSDAGSVLIEIASINFLIGASSVSSIDFPDWGLIIGYGIRYIRSYWWISFFPGLFISLLAIGLIFIGDSISENYSPLIRRRWRLWF